MKYEIGEVIKVSNFNNGCSLPIGTLVKVFDTDHSGVYATSEDHQRHYLLNTDVLPYFPPPEESIDFQVGDSVIYKEHYEKSDEEKFNINQTYTITKIELTLGNVFWYFLDNNHDFGMFVYPHQIGLVEPSLESSKSTPDALEAITLSIPTYKDQTVLEAKIRANNGKVYSVKLEE